MHVLALRIRVYLTFIYSQVEMQCQSLLKLEKTFSFQLASRFSHIINKNKNCSEFKIAVVNVKRESDERLEAQKADAMPLDHPRVHCYAGSQKYYGDFMAPSSQGFG